MKNSDAAEREEKQMKRNTGKRRQMLAVLSIAAVLGMAVSGCGASPQDVRTDTGETGGTETETAVENNPAPEGEDNQIADVREEEETEMKMQVEVGGSTFTATLVNNSAATELAQMMRNQPVVIQMSDYAGFEKVGSLGRSLPTQNRQTTTQSGDIVLYNGNQIVIFYGSNSWSYTRLGKIRDLNGWKDALGKGDVEVTFSVE